MSAFNFVMATKDYLKSYLGYIYSLNIRLSGLNRPILFYREGLVFAKPASKRGIIDDPKMTMVQLVTCGFMFFRPRPVSSNHDL